eukprot:TRINITY_DN65996_c0_g1_i1.p1 TRINITY_DN65996_c0_g1~~TRINITY_DN65996_c0_g1_i1.p1  ORF type:complete len:420 (-),score=38.75 TRINITY_DN65996_c0_g1_i1:46-1155(-)
MKNLGITPEQRSLLTRHSHSLKPLTQAGYLNIWQAFQLTWLPTFIFVFSVLCLTCTPRMFHGQLIVFIRWLGVLLMLAIPAATVAVFVAGVATAWYNSRARWQAVTYWGWWPCWRLAMCLIAVTLASRFGDSLWFDQFLPYQQMMRLQAYKNIGPNVTGVRLQDAGVVMFDAKAGVDRARTGCLKNGATYCVAPIVLGDELGSSTKGSHDLFMAGVDCCSCPGEFRCGAWNMPARTLGGLRVASADENSFFQLAAQQWGETFGRRVDQPLFFQWVVDPVSEWHALRERGVRLLLLTCIGVPFCFIMMSYVLNGILKLLSDNECAAPIDTPMLSSSMGQSLTSFFLPSMYQHRMERQAAQQSPSPHYAVL